MEHVAQVSRDDGYVSQEQGGNLVQFSQSVSPVRHPGSAGGLMNRAASKAAVWLD